MATEQILPDGTKVFLGGMDSSRSPSEISDTQYSRACNLIIPKAQSGISSRFGIHCCHLKWDFPQTRLLYENNPIQGEGFFLDKSRYFLIRVVRGHILLFTPMTFNSFYVRDLTPASPMSETADQIWVTRVPFGCIVQDGLNFPIYVTEFNSRKLDPGKKEVGIGRMGVYVQNRYCYSDVSGRIIYVSDFMNPTKFQEAYDFGILGFAVPEDGDVCTAVGKQKVMLNYAEGGALCFATASNMYSCDIRYGRSDWGTGSLGIVQQSVAGLGCCSHFSLESVNTNLIFRNAQYGICDLRQSQFQFERTDDYISQSVEASYWLEQDTPWMLKNCYIRSFGPRYFTTIAPELDDNGGIFWNGLLAAHPAARYSNQNPIPRRFESIFTGVRPRCITNIPGLNEERFFIDSYDSDGKNRLYTFDPNSNFDLNHRGNRVEIEGWLETRAFNFKQPFAPKKLQSRFMRLDQLDRSVSVSVSYRPGNAGPWTEYFNCNLEVESCAIQENGCFMPSLKKPVDYRHIVMPTETVNSCYIDEGGVLEVQDRIEFKGPINLIHFVRLAVAEDYNRTTFNCNSKPRTNSYSLPSDFSYSISNSFK